VEAYSELLKSLLLGNVSPSSSSAGSLELSGSEFSKLPPLTPAADEVNFCVDEMMEEETSSMSDFVVVVVPIPVSGRDEDSTKSPVVKLFGERRSTPAAAEVSALDKVWSVPSSVLEAEGRSELGIFDELASSSVAVVTSNGLVSLSSVRLNVPGLLVDTIAASVFVVGG
jgi:hypothetical protein